MTDDECEAAFEQLQDAMKTAGLQWVTDQVDEEIRFGRTVIKTISSHPDTPEDLAIEGLAEKPRKSKVSVSATRPYTAREKLTSLLDALEGTVIETDEMQKSVRGYLSSHAKNWQEIRLLRTDQAGREPIIIAPAPDEGRSRAVASLQTLVTSLKSMI